MDNSSTNYTSTDIEDIGTNHTIDKLFEYLEDNFESYHDRASLKSELAHIHTCLRLHARRDYLDYDVGLALYYFYEHHKETELDMMICVQIIHQVVHSLHIFNNEDISFSTKVFIQLAKQLPTLNGRVLVSNIIACIKLYMKMCTGNSELIQILWVDLSQRLQSGLVASSAEIDILMQLFDEFCAINPNLQCDVTLVATIQSLLKSNQRDNRKCGYFLFKKMIQRVIECLLNANNIWLHREHSKQVERSWILYITILENLEENQSHLILPSLKNLNEIIANKQVESSWLDILFRRILTHKNNLVLRWSIEFFLDTFSCAELHKDILGLVLEAVNNNILYNCEGYFIDNSHFSTFLNGDLSNLYEILGEVNWKPVPLCNLLKALTLKETPKSMHFQLVLKIASRVRTLTDVHIRQVAAYTLNTHFCSIIDKMTIMEYVTYVETLFTTADNCNIFDQLYKKMHYFNLNQKEENIFKRRFFEIAVANVNQTTLIKLITFLENIPVEFHGWLRFLPFHFGQLCKINEKDQHKLEQWYGFDLNSCCNDGPLSKSIEYYAKKLMPNASKDELEQCNVAVIATYLNHLDSLDNESDNLRLIFSYNLPEQSVRNLCRCLDKTNNLLEPWVINRLIELLSNLKNNYDEYYNLCLYLEKQNECDEYLGMMLEKCPRFVKTYNTNILHLLSWPDFFCDDVKKGEARIEESYRFNYIGDHVINKTLRFLWHSQIKQHGDMSYALYLLNCHKDISKKKQRYFANSYDHRIKMRIAWGIATILPNIDIDESIFDEFWNILLNENNQLNITCFYEYLIGSRDNRNNTILDKLNQAHCLTSSQQVSIISVTHTYCACHPNLDEVSKNLIVMHLMSLTMGANFHTRLFAQMALLNILRSESFSTVQSRDLHIKSILTATRDKLEEHLGDIRLHLFTKSAEYAWDLILYATNTPYDEIVTPLKLSELSSETQNSLTKYRASYSKKTECTAEEQYDDLGSKFGNLQIQRKMNPSDDVIVPNNLIVYPVNEINAEMFVIASLVDKLPNLGGIARTCEVLGIRNFVMDSKRDVEKNDFKNISMTAEKSLNVIEVKQQDLVNYIINKRKEGFAVVGAEQTSNSETFSDFKFPEKCILLLGHEKDGIPPTLLGLLDHAVEIPQFGQVRSLNVHVTGALFMWEYCKQHLVQKHN